MVKLIVIARCVPEDVYLRSLESSVHVHPTEERKFSVVVRDPEHWYIGRLAVEIKTRYESIYKRQFGQIKYLKDNDDDCDLDPELSVADLLVDEGKAARDGADQKRIVKVIQEQGRALRQGSVIPDLTPIHYQPPARPPIPRFPDVEKRQTAEQQLDERPTKRRRLDQIEEETNHIVNSIEREALDGRLNEPERAVEPKLESPELASTWINTGPATVDELELLPEAPAHFRPRSKNITPNARIRQGSGVEIRESSIIPPEDPHYQSAPSGNHGPDRVIDRFGRQQSASIVQAPVTPPTAESVRASSSQALSMLNSMKSNTPNQRQSASNSTGKFRKPVRNVYDYPESDIDDTQMSPRSRALRSRITPKLVQTPRVEKVGTPRDESQLRNSRQPTAVQESPVLQKRSGDRENDMDVDGDKENQLLHLGNQEEMPAHLRSNRDGVKADIAQADEATSHQKPQPRGSFDADRSSVLGSDETWSIQEDGTRIRKKSRSSRNQRRSNGAEITTRSSSAASADRNTTNIGIPVQRKMKRKRAIPTKVSDVRGRSEISELDSPGMQLSETLRRSSPATRPSNESSQRVSEALSNSNQPAQTQQTPTQDDDVEMEDVERSPESVSDPGEDIPVMKTPKRPRTRRKSLESAATDELRCFTCWSKTSRCDNAQPKCNTCERNKKTCQIPNMTKGEAAAEKARRQSQKGKTSQSPVKRTRQSSTKSSADVDSATDREDESDHDQKLKSAETTRTRYTETSKRPTKTQSKSQGSTSASASDRNEDSEQEDEPKTLALQDSHGKTEQSSDRKTDIDTNSKDESSPLDSKTLSAPIRYTEASKKPNTVTKKKAEISASKTKTQVSPGVDENERVKAKSLESSFEAEIPVLTETAMAVTPLITVNVPPAVTKKPIRQEQSPESHTTKSEKILPAGMTEEAYEALIKSRASLTNEQRNEQKTRARKLQQKRDSTPSVRRQSSTQEVAERSKQDTPSVRSSQRIPASSQSTNKTRSKPPPSTQPARIPVSVTSNTPSASQPAPRSAPAKSRPDPPATNSSKAKLKLQPTSNKSTKTKSPNPAIQPSTQRNLNVPTSISTISPSLTTSRSLKDIRTVLKSQSLSGSGASTPQPASTIAAKVAGLKRNVNPSLVKRTMFSLSDEDDEDDSDSDEDSDDGDVDQKKKRVNTSPAKPVNGGARANGVIQRRAPSDSGSASASGTESEGEREFSSRSTEKKPIKAPSDDGTTSSGDDDDDDESDNE